jgi:hypothetical protein
MSTSLGEKLLLLLLLLLLQTLPLLYLTAWMASCWGRDAAGRVPRALHRSLLA